MNSRSTELETTNWKLKTMLRNYFKIAVRNLMKNKSSSFINIGGLAVGMAVAILIGLWIWDELSFNKYHENYQSIAQVMQHRTFNGEVNTGEQIPLPLETELRKSYGSDFKHIVMSSWTNYHFLNVGEKNISYAGNFMGAEGPEMFSMEMLQGDKNSLENPTSILISQSIAKALFADADPMNQLIKIDNGTSFKITGVYKDFPKNTTLTDVAFLAPWSYYRTSKDWIKEAVNDWGNNSFQMFVQIADNTNMQQVSEKIKDAKRKNISKDDAKYNPVIFLQPMSKWHLYSKFTNGVNTGGAIEYVWLFGIIGMFVLLLACINFMNLSTARSEKRAKEVGIRKAIGSLRGQLISQFFCESVLMAMLAFGLSLLLVWTALPFFNEVASKKIEIPVSNPSFWLMCIGFALFTGIIAGSYPALYLSSFEPIKVLKGTFKMGKLATMPRKVLVVLQFTVSVVLIIGTIVVFKQIQFAKNRPVGYSREGLISVHLKTDDLREHFEALQSNLLSSGLVTAVAEASSNASVVNNNRGDIEWKKKDPSMPADFATIRITTGFGKTVGWQFTQGRDFSQSFATDSSAVVINEAAVKYMNLKNPVGEAIKMGNMNLHVIGVIKDMVMQSPYDPVRQTIFYLQPDDVLDYLNIKINPNASVHTALNKIAAVCKTYSPSVPFAYKFADEEYAKKFITEERIGKLASFFAGLAIFISCLGLFGMASFMAEQRVKEIGVRKILGASTFNLWKLLSKEFVMLVLISLVIATPIAYSFMNTWLQNYQYRTELSWWIFIAASVGALTITIITVSFQAIKAAVANPVKSLRSE